MLRTSCLSVAALASLLSSAFSQELIVNGSFEQTAASGCAFNLSNSDFTQLMRGAKGFGPADMIDIMEGDCTYGLPPIDGKFKIGIGVRFPMPGQIDAFSLGLRAPLEAEATYRLQFFAQAVLEPFAADVGTLEIGVSGAMQQFGTMIYSDKPSSSGWTQMGLTFMSPIDGATRVTVRIKDGTDSWIHLDRFSMVKLDVEDESGVLGISSTPLRPSVELGNLAFEDLPAWAEPAARARPVGESNPR